MEFGYRVVLGGDWGLDGESLRSQKVDLGGEGEIVLLWMLEFGVKKCELVLSVVSGIQYHLNQFSSIWEVGDHFDCGRVFLLDKSLGELDREVPVREERGVSHGHE